LLLSGQLSLDATFMPAPSATPLDLKPLTTMRIVAALWVVLADYWPDLRGAGAAPGLIAHGQFGVELFFVLSGFILSHVYLTSFGERGFRYGAFLWARLSRVYPLHFATLAAVGIMAGGALMLGQHLKHVVLYWPALPTNLLLINAWGLTQDAGWNHPAWSISAEWFAYLTFPLFAAAAWSLRNRPRLATGLALALLAIIYPLFRRLAGFELTDATIAWGALRIVPCFALGCAVNLLWRKEVIRTQFWAVVCSIGSLAAVATLVSISAPQALVVATFGGLILSLASLTSTGSRLFSNPVGVYLGEVSFAVYMVTVPWKMLSNAVASKLLHIDSFPLPVWLAYFAAVIPVAMVAHHLVERPARTAMRRLAERRQNRQPRTRYGLGTANA
jgi:peptidoglycan/LPS O-acetylase OafA/YrhL